MDSPSNYIEKCIQAGQGVLEDTLLTVDQAPWVSPPWASRYTPEHTRVVLSVTSGVNATTSTAGDALFAAIGPTTGTQLATQIEATGILAGGIWSTLYSLTVPESHNIRIVSWGIDIKVGVPENLRFRMQVSSRGGPPTPPNHFLSSDDVLRHQNTFVILQPLQTLNIQSAMIDATLAPHLIDIGVMYYRFQINRRTDDRAKSRASGRGVGCE